MVFKINDPQVRSDPEEFRHPTPLPLRHEEIFELQTVVAEEEE